MRPRVIGWVAGVSFALLAVGVVLAHKTEADVSIRRVTLANDVPAIQFSPVRGGKAPKALIGHGVFCSKEMMFCYGEALAHAGFDCVSIDFPGHGASPERFSTKGLKEVLARSEAAFGAVDVYVGHSMGAYAGGKAENEGKLSARLFIAVGAAPQMSSGGPPLILISGQQDELLPASWLRTRTDARVEIFNGCDHLLELYDPRLVNAAVEAACATVGITPPAPPTCWRWRLAGMLMGWLGAMGLAGVALVLCRHSAKLARVRAPLFAIILLGGSAAVTGTWIGALPHLRRLPWQIGAGVLIWLVVTGLARLRVPRWSLLALAGVVLIGVVISANALVLLSLFFVLTLLVGTICAAIVARGGSRSDGDITLAIFAGYTIGQWIVMMV